MKTVGEIVRKIRGKEDRKTFAKKIGISVGYLTRIECNLQQPGLKLILKLSELGNVKVEKFLYHKKNGK